MLKKLPLGLVFTVFGLAATYGQTIVSTSPENKNVVLEEFTGIHCQYCPDGHAISQAIQAAHPDDVSLINVHAGGYANPGNGEPDFRTAYGSALANQTQLYGYPAGTINRHNFPGYEQQGSPAGATAQGRGSWATTADITLGQTSDVNVGVEATIDVQTNQMIVHVEAYYTSNSSASTNLLNVALLQNNTKGPQTGAGMGDEYVHQHRLVELITGQWGETINTTTSGTFVNKTYTYTIPADYKGVPVVLEDMEVVAFISNTHQEIPNGNRALPTFTNFANADDASVKSVSDISPRCGDNIAPTITVQNLGGDPLTSLAIDYSVNGGATQTYNWTGNITSLRSEAIDLPSINYTLQANNTVEVSVQNDEDNSNNAGATTFEEAIGGTGTVNMLLKTDKFGSECTWTLKNNAGEVLYSGGPYPNGQFNVITETFQLPADCYTFTVLDSAGDGGGPVKLTDSDGTVVYYNSLNFGAKATGQFSSDGVLGVTNVDLQNISIYPNPASTVLNISNAENSNVEVYNILGQLLVSKQNIALNETLNVTSLQTGTYLIKITKDNQVTTKRFVVSK